jgi:hypothetical protein
MNSNGGISILIAYMWRYPLSIGSYEPILGYILELEIIN